MQWLARSLIASMTIVMFSSVSVPAIAQPSAAEMLEQARTRAREIEDLKAVLNGPDQNMRLAAFDIMINSGDGAMRQLAIDIGLASADSLLQGMAFKEAILSLTQITMAIEIDTTQPETVQQKAQAILNASGSTYTLMITDRDKAAGTFKMKQYSGQVSGTVMNFKNSYDTGTLSLADETTITGSVTLYKGGYGVFNATARIR